MENKVKVLVIRFSSIGDIVLCSPVIRCLKTQLEGEVEVHFVTKAAYSKLLKPNPYLSKVYSVEKSTHEVIDQLKEEQYDYIIDLHKNIRSLQIKRKLKALSWSFNKLNWQKWLLVNLKIKRLPDTHIVDRYLNTTKALGIENDGNGLDFFLPKSTSIPNFLSDTCDKKYHVLAISANHATKKIPKEKLIELIAAIDNKLVIIGGKEDQELGAILHQQFPQKTINAVGKTSLEESALIIKGADLVISPDTGMMHIAAAFNKKIISIWGNTVPEFGMYPYLKDGSPKFQVIENKELSCRPCSKIGFDKCPKGHFKCMLEADFSSLELD